MVLGDRNPLKSDIYYENLDNAIDEFHKLMNNGMSHRKAWKKVEKIYGFKIADVAASSV